ncbi:MAG: aminotransferase class I/II-fold pyridoxal phosphate-dependent enzyme [Acidobacteria bacterium]|nr:aminotransferase class I/II-fold pyridoxal phosphate-dependent enzyme [Acidobacteriota bacterium]
MSVLCTEAGGINLGQGICDIDTEHLVAEGAIDAIRENLATYSRMDGIDLLRKRIAEKAASFNRIEADPDGQIIVTVGATGGYAMAVLATLEPGDEIIVFEPWYGYHVSTPKLLGVGVRSVRTHPPDWRFDPDELAAAFNDRTRAIVVCTPSNPSGKVFRREELELIGQLAIEHDCLVFTDEIYEYIVYEGSVHLSMASMPGLADRVITISGFSKTFSITGWRIGYVIAPPDIAPGIALLNDLFYVCAPTPLQWGVAAGLEIDQSYYRKLAEDYEDKRDMLASALRDAGFQPWVPQGAYYMLAGTGGLGYDHSREAAESLLERAGVAAVPGAAFHPPGAGEDLLRFCFAKSFEDLEEACRRLRDFGRKGD